MDNDPQNSPQPQPNSSEPVQPIAPNSEPVMPTTPNITPEPVTSPTFSSESAPTQPPKESKKKLIIILIIIAVLLIGGGVVAYFLLMPKNTTGTSDTIIENNDDSRDDKVLTESVNSDLPVLYRDGLIHMTINAPNYVQSDNGYSRIFTTNGYFIIVCRGGEVQNIPLSGINNYNLTLFDMSTNTETRFGVPESITSTSSTDVTINGINMLRFVGSVHYKNSLTDRETDGYIMGYNFILEGIPVQLLGVINERDQTQATKDKIVKDVDAMINTIKTNQP